MAELDTSSGGSKKGHKVRSKKASTRVDLTAMVDLAFLLVTFFMLTTTLSKPKAMDLIMPDKDDIKKDELPVPASRTMTILLGSGNRVEWWVGEAGKSTPTLEGFGKNEIRKSILANKEKIEAASGKDMIVIIKPSAKSVYSNMVNMLDEMNITGVERYAIVDMTADEISELKKENIYN